MNDIPEHIGIRIEYCGMITIFPLLTSYRHLGIVFSCDRCSLENEEKYKACPKTGMFDKKLALLPKGYIILQKERRAE